MSKNGCSNGFACNTFYSSPVRYRHKLMNFSITLKYAIKYTIRYMSDWQY